MWLKVCKGMVILQVAELFTAARQAVKDGRLKDVTLFLVDGSHIGFGERARAPASYAMALLSIFNAGSMHTQLCCASLAEDKVSLEVSNPFLQAFFWVINLLVYKVHLQSEDIFQQFDLAGHAAAAPVVAGSLLPQP